VKKTEWNWCVWFRTGSKWLSLPFTARMTRAESIREWARCYDRYEWEEQRRAGDVRCIRTLFTAEVP